jgi:hypothetical protein
MFGLLGDVEVLAQVLTAPSIYVNVPPEIRLRLLASVSGSDEVKLTGVDPCPSGRKASLRATWRDFGPNWGRA